MPHRFGVGTSPLFLLHSSSSGVGGFTWGPNDRDVQASDVYADFGQVCNVLSMRVADEVDLLCISWRITRIAILPPPKHVGAYAGCLSRFWCSPRSFS